MARFPNSALEDTTSSGTESKQVDNPASQVFGHRFYKDQTPIEYLAEFLLVFASPKDEDNSSAYSFPLYPSLPPKLTYQPRYKLALKLFSFLGASKLETRHQCHIKAFRDGSSELGRRIAPGSKISRNDGVRLIQGVFSGFVGVAGDRTWTAHTFLPASESLLAREILWRHGGNNGAAKNPHLTWYEALTPTSNRDDFFRTDAHSFMARGGELLYLQLANLFNTHATKNLGEFFPGEIAKSYNHLDNVAQIDYLRLSLQQLLTRVLRESDETIGILSKFVSDAFEGAEVDSEGPTKPAILGWVPTESATEASLFAWEIDNICKAQRSGLQKLALMKDLCVLHVMRSLCFQSARITNMFKTENFIGNYAWIVSPPGDQSGDNVKKLAINSYVEVENLLFESLRAYDSYESSVSRNDKNAYETWLNRGDDNVVRLFRKIGKQIGMIVPRTGQGMRITLPAHIVRLLVAALIAPGKKIQLNTFYERIFAHYGLAISQEMIQQALTCSRTQEGVNAFGIDSSWFEEELRRGGYLIPLSDAVALVLNPYKE